MTRETLGQVECDICGREIVVYRGKRNGGLYANCAGTEGCGARYHWTAGSSSAEYLEQELKGA